MKRILIIFVATIATLFTSCDKEYSEFYSDNRPEIPVTYEGAKTEGFNPYIEIPLTKNTFSLTLTIPESSGRTIQEISKVLGGSTSINAGGVRSGTYISSPILGNGNKVVFNTSVSEFRGKNATNEKLIKDFENSTTLQTQEIAFMFLLKLDNNQEIIPVQARVWLKK